MTCSVAYSKKNGKKELLVIKNDNNIFIPNDPKNIFYTVTISERTLIYFKKDFVKDFDEAVKIGEEALKKFA